MDALTVIAAVSIVTAGLTIALGSIGPALGEARAAAQALQAIAQQPDEANTITRTLFVSLAMIESTAIYCFVVAMILLFANPFWTGRSRPRRGPRELTGADRLGNSRRPDRGTFWYWSGCSSGCSTAL